MPKIVPPARVAMFAALASLAMPAALVERALADKPSTSVTVTNPATSPALTRSVDDPGRLAYQARQFAENCRGVSECRIDFPPVPAGYRLVILHVSGSFLTTDTVNPIEVDVLHVGSTGESSFFAPSVGGSTAFDQPVLVYVEAGQTPRVDYVLPPGPATIALGAGAILTGYLLDCTATPCAPIAPTP